ncbi:MAG TPA: hypothetical protein VN833_22960, partial [Candidatus Acidoferrales bacterium]|nr:hypothetical protein [Candidatus Acidoferrales bacterium]
MWSGHSCPLLRAAKAAKLFTSLMSIASNIASIHERITAAARRAGRNPEDIILMAVSKTQPPEKIREAYKAGLKIFGENRVQEFSNKIDAL